MKIMKKNILFGVVCVALLTATSCSDFLDVQPEGDARDNAYFLNDQQAIDAVDGLYERFSSGSHVWSRIILGAGCC